MTMMSLGYSVRLYELLPDGGIEPLMGGDISYFGGACPNVGDTIGRLEGLDDAHRFYSVQRRMFIDTFDGDQGWVVLVRSTDTSPLVAKVMREWIAETKAWHRVDERAKRKSDRAGHRELMKLIAKKPKRASSARVPKTPTEKKD